MMMIMLMMLMMKMLMMMTMMMCMCPAQPHSATQSRSFSALCELPAHHTGDTSSLSTAALQSAVRQSKGSWAPPGDDILLQIRFQTPRFSHYMFGSYITTSFISPPSAFASTSSASSSASPTASAIPFYFIYAQLSSSRCPIPYSFRRIHSLTADAQRISVVEPVKGRMYFKCVSQFSKN